MEAVRLRIGRWTSKSNVIGMYSQFCYYIQQEEQRRRATMYIPRKPGEQVEVDWAGDPAFITDPDTGEVTPAHVFVGALSYSQYPYVEACLNEQQAAWITAHVHMFEYFGGVPRILVPDNCKTAVIHNHDWNNPQVNAVYHEMAEHYNCAMINRLPCVSGNNSMHCCENCKRYEFNEGTCKGCTDDPADDNECGGFSPHWVLK